MPTTIFQIQIPKIFNMLSRKTTKTKNIHNLEGGKSEFVSTFFEKMIPRIKLYLYIV